ncbi:MAG TPA: CIA30 family protein [bacterium]|nr:CIA30 family protein [bacterium]
MKKMFPFMVFLAAGLLWAQVAPSEGSLTGWTNDQLKAEIYRQRREILDLRAKLGMGQTVEIKDKGSVKVPEGAWKLDDFEQASPNSGIGYWSADCDHNNMGTALDPSPYQRLEKGSPLSPGYCAGMKGHLGPNEAPWTWSFLSVPLNNQGKVADLNGFKELWFAAKGDGKYYIVTLRRQAVKDYCEFQADFQANDQWTLVKIALSHFAQPSWGTQLPHDLSDVTQLAFSPEIHEADYDLKVDDVVLVK